MAQSISNIAVLTQLELGLERSGYELGEPIVACVSGGPDSTALMLALHELMGQTGQIYAAHFNHRTRGAESDGDEDFVRGLCDRLGIPLRIGRAEGASEHLSEDSARRMRYDFIQRVAADLGAGFVVVAHTADDQAETLLLRITRGTGIRGLRGMRYWRPIAADSPIRLIRPLLGTTRAELDEFLTSRGVQARVDSSNADTRYARNRIRKEVLPPLEVINPAVVAALNRLAEDAGVHESMVERRADQLHAGGDSIETALLSEVEQPVAAAILRKMHRNVSVGGVELERQHIEDILKHSLVDRPVELHLPGNVVLRHRYGTTTVATRSQQSPGDRPVTLGEASLTVPGEIELPDGSTLTAELAPVPTCFGDALGAREKTAHLSASTVARHSDYVVRGRRAGDIYRQFGGTNRVKVQDLFVNAKIPVEQRDSIPIVARSSCDEIIWVAGFPPADGCEVRPDDNQCVKLTWLPAP